MATVDHSTNPADSAREGMLVRYPLVLFFVLSFVFTWGYFWLIWAPLGMPDSLIALGGFGPAVSALLVLAISSGKPGVLSLLRSIVHWHPSAGIPCSAVDCGSHGFRVSTPWPWKSAF